MRPGIVLPTRHRPEVAITSIQALLAQEVESLSIVVSDNSSRDDDVRRLREFCEACGDSRLLYIRPPEVLDMAAHWDWALTEALARTSATHFEIQYDRKVLKREGLAELAGVCRRNPGRVVTHPCDFTFAMDGAFSAFQYPGTANTYEISTARVAALSARGLIDEMGQAWPVLSNSMVPREILERIRSRFGSICVSVTPDASFAYRLCALEDRYVHFDRAGSVMHAFHLSNGQAYFRRDTSSTFGDFMTLWRDRSWLDAAPIPGLTLGLNVVFHEYTLVQREVGGDRFPPIDRQGYLRHLASGLRHIHDEEERSALRALLREHGWREEEIRVPLPVRAWRALGNLTRPVRRRLGLVASVGAIPDVPDFPSDAEALEYLLVHERPLARANRLLEILEAKELVSER